MYEGILIGVAVVAAIGLVGNGLIMWRQQGILKNDIEHLKDDVADIRHDVQWLTAHLKKNG